MTDSLLSQDANALKFIFDSPVYVLKSEFSESLISSEELSDSAIKNPSIKYIGGFEKKILFVISGNEINLSETDWDLFNKTVTALKLNNNDIGIIENKVEDPILNFSNILNDLKPLKTVVFGNIQCDEDSTNYSILKCETLKSLSENKNLKIDWWNSIKAFLA